VVVHSRLSIIVIVAALLAWSGPAAAAPSNYQLANVMGLRNPQRSAVGSEGAQLIQRLVYCTTGPTTAEVASETRQPGTSIYNRK
jgi:hypothetical protein